MYSEKETGDETVNGKNPKDAGKEACQGVPYHDKLNALRDAHYDLIRAMVGHYGMNDHGRLMCAACLHAIHSAMLSAEIDLLGADDGDGGGHK